MPMPDLGGLPATMMRPFVVAIAHLPIIVFAVFVCPMCLVAAFRPKTHSAVALQFLQELRMWSADVVTGSARPRTP